jgi:hypothetical protein
MPVPDPEVRSAGTKALVGLILGIANFMFCPLFCIPALILGNQALAVLNRPDVPKDSRGLAVAARVLGIIGIAAAVILAVVWVVVVTVLPLIFRGGSQP